MHLNASDDGAHRMSSAAVAPLLSPYRMGGYREDELSVDEGRIVGKGTFLLRLKPDPTRVWRPGG